MVVKKIVYHACNKETEIALIKANLENQNKMLEEIHHKIVGNGRPGLVNDVSMIQKTVEENSQLLKKHEDTISGINLKLAYYSGAIAIIFFVIQYALKYLKI